MKKLNQIATLFFLGCVTCMSSVYATDLSIKALHGRWQSSSENYYLGQTVAHSDKWIAIGAPSSADRSSIPEGAVQLFDKTTLSWKRRIHPPLPVTPNRLFGSSLAIQGDILAVGAYGEESTTGRIYLYNASTGAMLRNNFTAPDRATGDGFGWRICISGEILIVAAPGDDSARGAVYLFNLSTGEYIHKIVAADGAASDSFGYEVAVEGNILAISARGDDSSRGSVYFYNLSTRGLLIKHQPSSSVAGDSAGISLSMHQGCAIIGTTAKKAFLYKPHAVLATELICPELPIPASFGNRVAISGNLAVVVCSRSGGTCTLFLYNAVNGSSLGQRDLGIEPDNSPFYGLSIVLAGNSLLMGSPDFSGLGAARGGTAFLISPLIAPMRYEKIAATGEYAPGAYDVSFGKFGEAFSTPSSESLFVNRLTGRGSRGGKDDGVFFVNQTDLLIRPAVLSGEVLSPTTKVARLFNPIKNNVNDIVGFGSASGTGLALTNHFLWSSNGSALNVLRKTNEPLSELGGAMISKFNDLVQPNQSGLRRVGSVLGLKLGTSSTTAANDSAVWTISSASGSSEAVREDDPVTSLGGSVKYGQISPRLCYFYSLPFFHSALKNTPATSNSAIFRVDAGPTASRMAMKGQAVPDLIGTPDPDGIQFSTFLGESANGINTILFRASMSGPGITSRSNEGLWSHPVSGGLVLITGKGHPYPGTSTIRVSKILKFWSLGSSSNQYLYHVQLTGDRVTASNDTALILYQTDRSKLVILREGDPAPGCAPAKIGTLANIAVDPYSSTYALLVTLTGSPASSNLALYTGDLLRGNDTHLATLRLPVLRLRKGQLFQNQMSPIKSISLPTTSTNTSGAGANGRAQAISWNKDLTVLIEFNNGVRQIMAGTVN